ncbi:DNA translocase FtsK [Alteribacter natronophilus]|nr:DNA translocase FtsK [Alteribacter natronophilus]
MMNQVKNLFSTEEEESQAAGKQQKKPSAKKKSDYRQGTSIHFDKGEEPKVLHQYPRTGAFRFPVVKDHEPIGKNAEERSEPEKQPEQKSRQPRQEPVNENRESESHSEQRTQLQFDQSSGTGNSEVNKAWAYSQPQQEAHSGYIEKQKFAGQNFSVRQIPSPIFGFGKRDEDTLQKYREDVLNEFLELEGLVTPGDSDDGISGEENQEPERSTPSEDEYRVIADEEHDVEQPDFAEESAAAAETESPAIVPSVREEEPGDFHEQENDNPISFEVTAEEEAEEQTEEQVESPESVTPADSGETEEPAAEKNLTEEIVDQEEEDQEYTSIEEKLNRTSRESTAVLASGDSAGDDSGANVNESRELSYTNDTAATHEKEAEAREAVRREAPAGMKEEKTAPRKPVEKSGRKSDAGKPSALPYNVLMFQRDRVKQERREKQNRGKGALPELHLLEVPPGRTQEDDEALSAQSALLDQTLSYFSVKAKVVNVTRGPSVTRFEIQPEPGVKVSKITNLQDDIKLSLAARDIRMEAPIPGKNTIGIEVPNQKADPVFLREILKSPAYLKSESPLTAGLGVDISGQPVVTDLQKMPHGLIAGATGSGKSVCVNAILLSLLYKASPEDVRMLLIDPKMVELAPYNGLPHLAAPVITDAKEATLALKWAVEEMDRRYERFAETGARDLTRYNKKMREQGKEDQVFPYLVVVVDELADLMMVSPQEVEDAICRIAQKARACGIHLLVATQRPSVDVITGLIKANIPTRIAFSVSAQTDSRTILDTSGAERLLGRGDMLFLGNGESKAVRLQGAFVSDDEIERVTEHVKKSGPPRFLFEKEELSARETEEADDPLFEEVCRFIVEQEAASTSLIQRRFRMGFNRAARMIDLLEDRGIISPAKGSKPRDVYLTKDELEESFAEKG